MGDIFLNGIKYAGGVSNIFDPIIYSTTERKIGVWTDNKPLYQKTLIYTNQALSYGDTDLSLGVSNMETIVDSRAYITNSAHTTYRPLNSWTTASASQMFYLIEPSTGTLRVHAEGSWPSPNIYITIQYTKTTDVAGSGDYNTYGVPTEHYSTNEQVVGTWIDGKPVYERLIDLNGFSIDRDTWYSTNIPLSNYNIKGFVEQGSLYQEYNGFIQVFPCALGIMASTYIGVDVKWDGGITTRAFKYLKIRYTKTTD